MPLESQPPQLGDLASSASPWQSLLPQLLEEVGLRLGTSNDVRAARLVCHHWRTHVTGQLASSADRELPLVSLHPDVDRFQQMLTATATCFPYMRSCKVYLSGRLPAEVTDREIVRLTQLQHLTHLTVSDEFVPCRGNPDMWMTQIPVSLPALTFLQSLDLYLSDCPRAGQVGHLVCLTGLRRLKIDSGGWMYTRVQQYNALSQLSGLRSLTLPLQVRIQDEMEEELEALGNLVAQLTSLADLCLPRSWTYGHLLPHLVSASPSLTHLSCGLLLSVPPFGQDPPELLPPSCTRHPRGSPGSPRLSLKLQALAGTMHDQPYHDHLLRVLSCLASFIARVELLGVRPPQIHLWLQQHPNLHPTALEVYPPDADSTTPPRPHLASLEWANVLVLEEHTPTASSAPLLSPVLPVPSEPSGAQGGTLLPPAVLPVPSEPQEAPKADLQALRLMTELTSRAHRPPALHHLGHLRALHLMLMPCEGGLYQPLNVFALPTSLTRLAISTVDLRLDSAGSSQSSHTPTDTSEGPQHGVSSSAAGVATAPAAAVAAAPAAVVAARPAAPARFPLLQQLQLLECTIMGGCLAHPLAQLLAQAPRLASLRMIVNKWPNSSQLARGAPALTCASPGGSTVAGSAGSGSGSGSSSAGDAGSGGGAGSESQATCQLRGVAASRTAAASEAPAEQLLGSCSGLTMLALESRGADRRSCDWLPEVDGWVAGLRSLRCLDLSMELDKHALDGLPQALRELTNLHSLSVDDSDIPSQLEATIQALPLATSC